MSFLAVNHSSKENKLHDSDTNGNSFFLKRKGVKLVSVLVAFSLGITGVLSSMPSAYAAENQTPTSSVSDEAFQEIMKSSFPLTPEQLHTYKTALADYEKAKQTPAGDVPLEGTSNMMTVDLKPGASMTLINMSYNNITTLQFTDRNGNPWPIASLSVGDTNGFHMKDGGIAGMLIGTASKRAGNTNMVVTFKGFNVPVVFNLIVGANSKTYDYLNYIKIPFVQEGMTDESSQLLTEAPGYLNGILQGLPPKGAQLLKTNSNVLKVWRYGDKYLVSTRATLLSPGYKARVNSPKLSNANVYHAYEIRPTPVIMLSVNGVQEAVNVIDNTVTSIGPGNNGSNLSLLGGGNL